jgi:hypothetical protein
LPERQSIRELTLVSSVGRRTDDESGRCRLGGGCYHACTSRASRSIVPCRTERCVWFASSCCRTVYVCRSGRGLDLHRTKPNGETADRFSSLPCFEWENSRLKVALLAGARVSLGRSVGAAIARHRRRGSEWRAAQYGRRRSRENRSLLLNLVPRTIQKGCRAKLDCAGQGSFCNDRLLLGLETTVSLFMNNKMRHGFDWLGPNETRRKGMVYCI